MSTSSPATTPDAPPPAGGATPGPAAPAALLRSKAAWIGGLLLALLLPQHFIGALVAEREARNEEVQREVGQGWGRAQTLLGPVLALPYRVPVSRDASGAVTQWRQGTYAVLPTDLKARVDLAPESRRRGLFEAVVYAAKADMTGSFALPTAFPPEAPGIEVLWRDAYVLAGSGDLRAAGAGPALTWKGEALEPGDAAGDAGLCGPADALRWPVALEPPPEGGAQPVPFGLRLDLRGSRSFRLLPSARRTELALGGPWATPSFVGTELPARSSASGRQFSAEWTVGNRQPLVRRSLGVCGAAAAGSAEPGIGVELLEAVPTYRMVSRASKYAAFFLALSFATYAVFELTARVRIHPVQYGLLGCSVVLFPLLLLALGEPLGFAAAYALSAAAVTAQASLHTASATGRPALGAAFAAVLAALFGFLYVVLNLEAYSLLVGALALFAALSVVMAAARRVDWGG